MLFPQAALHQATSSPFPNSVTQTGQFPSIGLRLPAREVSSFDPSDDCGDVGAFAHISTNSVVSVPIGTRDALESSARSP